LAHDQDFDINPVAPSDANLTLKYTFDSDLTDSSGNAYHGVAVNDVSVHDGMLTIVNEDTWWTWTVPNDMNAVQVGGDFNSFDVFSNSYTLMMKVRDHEDRSQNSYDYVHPVMYAALTGTDGHLCQSEITWYQSYELLGDWGVGADHACIAGNTEYANVADANWHTIVFTYNADSGYHSCFVDGYGSGGGFEPWGSDLWFDNDLAPDRPWNTLIGGTWGGFPMDEEGTSLMTGDVNEFCIYDYVVSTEEAMYLATGSTDPIPVEIPVDEDANLYAEGFPNDEIDFRDYAILADHWMEEELWP
ncbi:hypothetical protein ACFL1G_06285, partial [Planctomycetota bacterium]